MTCGGVTRRLFYGRCHGEDERKVLAKLCQLVEETIKLYQSEGRSLPPPTASKDYANRMLNVAYGARSGNQEVAVKKQATTPLRMPLRESDRRADQILQEIQKTLLPEHASEIVAINVETGEYVLAATPDEASDTFHERWPDQLAYVVRVDGGPVVKFHGK